VIHEEVRKAESTKQVGFTQEMKKIDNARVEVKDFKNSVEKSAVRCKQHNNHHQHQKKKQTPQKRNKKKHLASLRRGGESSVHVSCRKKGYGSRGEGAPSSKRA